MICNCSPETYSPNFGLKGINADERKILFVAHRSDSRALQSNYETELAKSQSGKILEQILSTAKLSLDDIYLTNVFKCLLPSDRMPKKDEYVACLSNLDRQIINFKPKSIVTFGHKPYELMFDDNAFSEVVGSRTEYHSIPTFISYHFSKIWSMPKIERENVFDNIQWFLERK